MPSHLKTCAKCKRRLPRTKAFFHKSARSPDGLHPRCSRCANEYSQTLCPKHREKAIARTRAWTKKNKNRHAANQRRWLDKNREQHNATVKVWAENNPETRRLIERRWAANNPDKIKAKIHRQRARRVGAEGSFSAQDVREQLKRQEGRCFWCGRALEKYHVDHVTPLAKGGTNHPSNIVCSCPRCNLKKSDKLPEVFRAEIEGINRADV